MYDWGCRITKACMHTGVQRGRASVPWSLGTGYGVDRALMASSISPTSLFPPAHGFLCLRTLLFDRLSSLAYCKRGDCCICGVPSTMNCSQALCGTPSSALDLGDLEALRKSKRSSCVSSTIWTGYAERSSILFVDWIPPGKRTGATKP